MTALRDLWVGCLVLLVLTGCATAPRLFPPAPVETVRSDAHTDALYDLNADGRPDYRERRNAAGAVSELALLDDTSPDTPLEVFAPPAAHPDEPADRHLLVILDSIPFEVVREVQARGRLAYFHRASRVIAPFPVMTDPALCEFFEVQCPAVEASFFDGRQLSHAAEVYQRGTHAPWTRAVDWALPTSEHIWSYIRLNTWYQHELALLQRAFASSSAPAFTGYILGPSAVGSKRGRTGHVEALEQLDRWIQQLVCETRGRVQITLMSDHGHNLTRSRRVSLRPSLDRLGYRAATTLRGPRDVILPEWGLVSCVALYTHSPLIAHDLAGFEEVELAIYRNDDDSVVVVGRAGTARISRSGDRYTYSADDGDPLRLNPVMAQLRAAGRVADDGSIADGDWWNATQEHEYPDAVARLWRAFHGLFTHEPTVLLSLVDGVYAGSADLQSFIQMNSVHGNLRRAGTTGFVMSTAAELPPSIRMADLRGVLQDHGLRLLQP